MKKRRHRDADRTTIMVSFLIIGDFADANEITSRMGIEPDRYHIRGDRIRTIPSQQRTLTNIDSCWEISTGYVEALDVNAYLHRIIRRLAPCMDALVAMKAALDLTYKVDIVVCVRGKQDAALGFDERSIAFAHRVGAMIDIDYYSS